MTHELLSQCREVSPEMALDEVLSIRERLTIMADMVKEARKEFDRGLTEWIQEHGPFVVGETRYYVAPKTTVKCVKPREAVEHLLDTLGGDIDEFVKILSANAIKHGAARSVLTEDQYAECFEKKAVDSVKEGKPDGKAPVLTVHSVNERFLK